MLLFQLSFVSFVSFFSFSLSSLFNFCLSRYLSRAANTSASSVFFLEYSTCNCSIFFFCDSSRATLIFSASSAAISALSRFRLFLSLSFSKNSSSSLRLLFCPVSWLSSWLLFSSTFSVLFSATPPSAKFCLSSMFL